MKYKELETHLNYNFENIDYLTMALQHSSYINEKNLSNVLNYERLEFLGDSIFGAIISEYLFFVLPNKEEGELTKVKSEIVRETSLANCGARLGIGEYLYLSKGEDSSGGRTRKSILADVMEAIIGAIYIDGGFEKTKEFVIREFLEIINAAIAGPIFPDYKTALQESLQVNGDVEISYIIERETGPDHEKTFFIQLKANGIEIGKGIGKSKKEAEQNAAKDALGK